MRRGGIHKSVAVFTLLRFETLSLPETIAFFVLLDGKRDPADSLSASDAPALSVFHSFSVVRSHPCVE